MTRRRHGGAPRHATSEGRRAMPTYVILGNYSDQGIRNIKDTTKRAEAFRNFAKGMGVAVKEIYWTMGRYDIVTITMPPTTPLQPACCWRLVPWATSGRRHCGRLRKGTWGKS